jgi:DNA invertase Pin-like site-specific DNA recombinase
LRDFAAKQGWEIVSEYIDQQSAKDDDRAQFQQMFQDASQRRFDVLLFWSLDRLSREGVLETLQHLQRLTSCGVAWKSFTEQYLDSTGIFREAVIGILAAIAKQESVRLAERTRAGLERVRREGKKLGRPPVKWMQPLFGGCGPKVHPGVRLLGVLTYRGGRFKRYACEAKAMPIR